MIPTVSVIMSVFNAEKYLDEAIQSILNQTFRDFEFIIINDGSIDKSLQIITQYAKNDFRIRIVSRKNKGLIISLNEGILQSRGQYIARMDADDISLPTRLQEQLNTIEQQNADICGCHYHIIDESGKIINNFIAPLTKESFMLYLTQTVPFAHGSVLMRKEFINKYCLTYGQTTFSSIEDYALWVKFYELDAKFTNVDKVLFKYRLYSTSFSSKKRLIMQQDTKDLSYYFINKFTPDIKKAILFLCSQTLSVQEVELLSTLIIIYFRRFKPELIPTVKKLGQKKLFLKGINYVFNQITKINIIK